MDKDIQVERIYSKQSSKPIEKLKNENEKGLTVRELNA